MKHQQAWIDGICGADRTRVKVSKVLHLLSGGFLRYSIYSDEHVTPVLQFHTVIGFIAPVETAAFVPHPRHNRSTAPVNLTNNGGSAQGESMEG